MRERDLRVLEFHKVIGLVAALAASEPGRRAVDALRPTGDPAEVAVRLRVTAEMVSLRAHAGALPMQEFADQRGVLLAAAREGAVLDGVALLSVRDFVLAARHVAAFMRSRVEPYPHLTAAAQNLAAPKELADALLGALADDGSLLDEASPQLARLRNRLRAERVELEARLARSLNASGMEPFVSDYLVTVRNHRFVLPLKLNYSERLEGIVQDRSVSGETLFVEPMWAVELNNRLMMLEREVEAEERRILAHLTAMIRGYGDELRITFDAMVALDALNARAIFAERLRCVEPVLGDFGQSGLELVEARHPLLMSAAHDVVPRDVVPIDVRIAPGLHGIVISGPNTGGKTVALKTIGLLALMAQAGLLIPAREGSHITVFRSIFADIGDEQSIEASLSSFAAHIANLREMAAELREPALVILDEPGEGTDPVEGAALAIGLMTYLGRRRCLVAIATHSAAIKLHAYSRAGFEASAVDFDADNLQPLYRLKPHTIGQSYGLAVAERLGLPGEIVAAAREAMPAGAAEVERVLALLEAERAEVRAEAERLRDEQRRAVELAAEVEETTRRGHARIEAERERVVAEGKALVAELRRENAAIAEEVKAGRKAQRELGSMLGKVTERIGQMAPRTAGETEGGAPREPLKVGDRVEFGDIQGDLIALEPGRAVVSRGGLRIEVAPERLRRAQTRTAVHDRTPKVTVSAGPGPDGGDSELNLIGMRTTEALRRLEEFLDQAYLTNRAEVRIVHGIGSGALKKAVHEYLSESPYCAGFRQADPHRGGAGATVVQLNL